MDNALFQFYTLPRRKHNRGFTIALDEQVTALEAMPPQDPSDIFTHMYGDLPPHLAEQMAEVLDEVSS